MKRLRLLIPALLLAALSGLLLASSLVTTYPPGQPVTLAIGSIAPANVTYPVSYQWRKNGTNIVGASGTITVAPTTANPQASFQVSKNAALGDAAAYTCVLTNSAGNVVSDTATLVVNVIEPPVITVNPQDQTVLAGASVTFTGAATGTAPITYQWQKDGVNVSGATSTTYTITSTVVGDAGSYILVATNAGGSSKSSSGALVVNSVVPPSGAVTVISAQ